MQGQGIPGVLITKPTDPERLLLFFIAVCILGYFIMVAMHEHPREKPNEIRKFQIRVTARGLVKAIGIYSILVMALISTLNLVSDAGPDQKAIIIMALGLILIWIVIIGGLMVRFKDPIRGLLLEEGVTVTMTNLAPLFGSQVGGAFITASANYLHTVLFHSVIVFIPMFLVWTVLLHFFELPPLHVFLLFGLTGSIAEMSMSPTNILAGFWFFVYGLMIYLPAYCLPGDRSASQPKWWAYPLAVTAPLLSPILLLPVTPLLRYLWRVMDPIFFVDSAWD
jgi:hypothetical protein